MINQWLLLRGFFLFLDESLLLFCKVFSAFCFQCFAHDLCVGVIFGFIIFESLSTEKFHFSTIVSLFLFNFSFPFFSILFSYSACAERFNHTQHSSYGLFTFFCSFFSFCCLNSTVPHSRLRCNNLNLQN